MGWRLVNLSFAIVTICATVAGGPVNARVLKVGPHEASYLLPSQAAAAARAGDTIEIAPGTYYDCAVWRAANLTIVGEGAILKDKTCAGRGIFVILGSNAVVRGITFTGAKVRDHNGAGIRLVGANLTVERAKFIDNEEGILAGNRPNNANDKIIIRDSYFKGNGNCVESCAHGIYVQHIGLLRIERTEFVGQMVGHHVKSRAHRTELIDNTIHDGPNGTASYLVDISNGGDLVMRGNVLEKGPMAENKSTAVSLGAEGATNETNEITIENNTFTNDLGQKTIFVRNRTGTEATLRGNKLTGDVTPLTGLGTTQR